MLTQKIHEIVSAALPESFDFTLEVPPNSDFGDFACNAAMLLSKKLGKNPREIATEIAEKLGANDAIEKVEIAGPGFINLFLKDEVVWQTVASAASAPAFPQQKILVEYGQENIAKPMSVGHLRSNIIGRSLVEIFRFLGCEVVTDNHLGDWGTQFGKLIVAYRRWGDRAEIEKNPIAEFNKIYVRFHDEAENNPELKDEARAEFKKLEDGDAENRELWEWMRAESLKEFERMYARLGSEFDNFHGEAFFENGLREIIADAIEKGVATRGDDNSVIVEFPEEFSPTPLLIQKSDGATLYATRDLAAVKFYVAEFSPDVVLQCVGSEQSLYFRQMYDAAVRLGLMGDTKFVHVANGLVRLPEGKMSTRSGKVVRLEDLLDEAEEKMRQILDEKNCPIEGDEREELIQQLAVGAVKFADLGRDREGNITFSWESALSFEGYAAPYLMYTHARASSILRKAGELPAVDFEKFGEPAERQLATKLLGFAAAVENSARSYKPHHVAQFIFELAQEFNSFYHAAPVLNAESDAEKNLRLALTAKTVEILAAGLGLLGIPAPEKM